MDEILGSQLFAEDCPKDVAKIYERIEILGKGAFGKVWLAYRIAPAENDYDDEFVALKSIELKEEKAKVYAEREISILNELRHPNVIRLVRAFPIHKRGQISTRWVALQLARGPNLQQLVNQRGALGLPLARLVARQLIAAVSYLHGRAVLHRDIKPNNCILEDTQRSVKQGYDWYDDDAIWSDGPDGEEAARDRWKLMLIDFGFARALEAEEIQESINMKWSIRNELNRESIASSEQSETFSAVNAAANAFKEAAQRAATELRRASVPHFPVATSLFESEESNSQPQPRRHSAISSFSSLPQGSDSETGGEFSYVSGENEPARPRRWSHNPSSLKSWKKRQSTARTQVRSMSALGTKAYAAPEIKEMVRHKTESDYSKSNAALTDSVADYGMIVDAYSVGWTLRVILTGVPPQLTISEYIRKKEAKADNAQVVVGCCSCFRSGKAKHAFEYRIRDTPDLPASATLLVTNLTKKGPDERMTVREAQANPWIRGDDNEEKYEVAQGDYPSHHGDPVVPLECAAKLAKLVQSHHAI
jgi:serine/threonine protein kinase